MSACSIRSGTRLGTFTWLTQASYLDSFQFAQLPRETEVELRSGGFGDEGYLKWRANSQLEWAWRGFDLVGTVHYLDGVHEILRTTHFTGIPFPNGIKEHYVKETWFFDVQASYTFNLAAGYGKDTQHLSVAADSKSEESAGAQTANSALPAWKRLLDKTTITIGCNNVFGHDPPDAASNTNYADFLYDATGRFVYVSLKKRF
jgi:outer membrane receptor protein involved in Fe transport